MADLREQEIISRAKAGDRMAFRELVELFQGFAYSVAYRFVGNAPDAEDLMQEAFIRVWKNLNRYDEQWEMKTWLGKIVTNVCLDYLKSAKKKNESKRVSIDETFPAVELKNPENEFMAAELHSLVIRFAEQLTPKQQAVFILRDLERLEVEEVCKILGMDASLIKSNLYHARMKIKSALSKYYKLQNNELQGM